MQPHGTNTEDRGAVEHGSALAGIVAQVTETLSAGGKRSSLISEGLIDQLAADFGLLIGQMKRRKREKSVSKVVVTNGHAWNFNQSQIPVSWKCDERGICRRAVLMH